MITRSIRGFAIVFIGLVYFPPTAAPAERLRVLIETDLGGDPDDEQSLVRFLLYVNEWDVEGIICTRRDARDGENLNPVRTGLEIAQAQLAAYGECHASLLRHDRRYPEQEFLARRTVAGYDDTDDGVRLIIAAVDSPDPRPIWFCNWGTDNGSADSSLKRALDQVLRERGQDGYARFKDRLRLSSDDQFEQHTTDQAPPWRIWVDTFRPPVDGLRWYHRFSALTATAGGFDIDRDLLNGHGPLAALYPTNTTHPQKEGDTMTFLYLVPTGMNDPDQPGWGSWAGRYGSQPTAKGRPYYWANQIDTWNGETHRDNILRRWSEHLQNDFRARLDWCTASYEDANHPPVAALRGDARHTVRAGDELELDASFSTDPDGDRLTYEWSAYPEVTGYDGPPIEFADARAARTRFVVPAVVGEQELHIILSVTDTGEPPLTRYQRMIVTMTPR